MHISLNILLWSLYIIIILLICGRIILDSNTPSKSLAYLLLVLLVPIFGVLFYLSVGLNYRKRKLYDKKMDLDRGSFPELDLTAPSRSQKDFADQFPELDHFWSLANFLSDKHALSNANKARVLINGEEKFPELCDALKAAKHHIHIEYYIYENDDIGNQLADILIQKVREGVEVRFIYDDFGSRDIRKNIVRQLKKAGVEAYPFYEINLIQFANRMNYRNHRKIVVVDGTTGFVGGINVSDKYINQPKNTLYWRDTHLKIIGPAVLNLQHTFLTDWNFCASQNVKFNRQYFPLSNLDKQFGDHAIQIISGGPDSDYPNILYSLVQLVTLAKEEVCITTPYFIPDKSFLDAIKISALSGVKVRLLVPGISDSKIVNLTSQSHYEDLLKSGVEIYLYQKGFVHAKTIVCDGLVSVIGTANLDNRSFDLNFETNAIVYGEKLAAALIDQFNKDIGDSRQLSYSDWLSRGYSDKVAEKVIYLFSPLM